MLVHACYDVGAGSRRWRLPSQALFPCFAQLPGILLDVCSDGNVGYANVGDGNEGDENVGQGNTGDRNHGQGNTGDENLGQGNTGNENRGEVRRA